MSEADDITARDARAAERFSPDVGREQIGEIYAAACSPRRTRERRPR